MDSDKTLPSNQKPRHFIQTELETHEAWGRLILEHPKAGAILHFLARRVGDHNAVVLSQKNLADLTGLSLATVKRALKVLIERNWIEAWNIGPTSSVLAYVLNSRVVWSEPVEKKRYALLSANIVLCSEDQDPRLLANDKPLKVLPRLGKTEHQLPSGNGMEPPSQPSFRGMEPELPALPLEEQTDLEDYTGKPIQLSKNMG